MIRGAHVRTTTTTTSRKFKTLDELDGLITTAEAGGDGRQEAISDATKSLKRLAGMRRSYNLEIKLLKDPASKAHYNLEKSKKDARLTELQSKFDFVQSSGQSKRDELFGGRRDVESGVTTERSAEAKLDEADQYQDKTEETFKNIIGVLQETEATADGTAVELTNQREQLSRITEEAIQIDTTLKRSDRLVKVFAKRMMTDKVRHRACAPTLLCYRSVFCPVYRKRGIGQIDGIAGTSSRRARQEEMWSAKLRLLPPG
ncbi:unnamed protein product [Scytosiphon promiscuus]